MWGVGWSTLYGLPPLLGGGPWGAGGRGAAWCLVNAVWVLWSCARSHGAARRRSNRAANVGATRAGHWAAGLRAVGGLET
eukprot:15084857-Alexandrium_andersonii.AAC.1